MEWNKLSAFENMQNTPANIYKRFPGFWTPECYQVLSDFYNQQNSMEREEHLKNKMVDEQAERIVNLILEEKSKNQEDGDRDTDDSICEKSDTELRSKNV